MAYVTETHVAGFFSVKIKVEGMPAALGSFQAHLNAARPNIMRFFGYGLPFKVKTQCLWELRDPDEGQQGVIGLTTRAMNVLTGVANSLNSWEDLEAWLLAEEARKREIVENSDKVFERVRELIILIHPGVQMQAAGITVALDDLEPPEPERDEDTPSDFVKLPKSLEAKQVCMNIQNKDMKSFQHSIVCLLEKTWEHTANPYMMCNYIPCKPLYPFQHSTPS